MSEFRDVRVEAVLVAGIALRADYTNTPNRQTFSAAIDALKGKTFYKTEDGPGSDRWVITYYNAGNESDRYIVNGQGRATKLVVKLNELLAGGWDPDA